MISGIVKLFQKVTVNICKHANALTAAYYRWYTVCTEKANSYSPSDQAALQKSLHSRFFEEHHVARR